jgi:O-antigen ligase
LAALAAVISYYIVKYRSIYSAIAIGLFAVLLVFLGPSRLSTISVEEASAFGRIDSWYAGVQMFFGAPLFGVGKGLYTDFNELTAHNSFVLVLAELGLFGLFFFVGLFWVLFKWVKRYIDDTRDAPDKSENAELIYVSSASLIGVATAMLFLSRAYTMTPYIVIGLLHQALFIGTKRARPNWLELAKEIFILCLLFIATLILFIKFVL